MSHDAQLEICRLDKARFERHMQDGEKFRDQITKHDHQILTIEKGMANTMEDIKDINNRLTCIDKKIDDRHNELRVWILTSAVAGLIALLGIALYYGGDKRQIEVNTKRLERIEEKVDGKLPRMSASVTMPRRDAE